MRNYTITPFGKSGLLGRLLFLIVLMVCARPALAGELLEYIDADKVKLTKHQQKALNTIWDDPSVENVWLARIKELPDIKFCLRLPDEPLKPTPFEIVKSDKGVLEDHDRGKLPYQYNYANLARDGDACGPLINQPYDPDCRMGWASIVHTDNNLFAQFQIDDTDYFIRSLGGGKQRAGSQLGGSLANSDAGENLFYYAFVKLLPLEKRPKERCGNANLPDKGGLQKPQETHNTAEKPAEAKSTGGTGCDFIRLLVLYNQSALDESFGQFSNILLEIVNGEQMTNQAFVNSGLSLNDVKVVLVGTAFVDFEGDIAGNVFESPHDDAVLLSQDAQSMALRDVYQADLVILMTGQNYQTSLGAVATLDNEADKAYGIVEQDWANLTYYTFTHEIGHLFGARHNHEGCSADLGCMPPGYSGCYNHGHQFYFKPPCGSNTARRTIMRVICGDAPGTTSTFRIPHFSNPDIMYSNTPTGTYPPTVPQLPQHSANNAMLLSTTACEVQNYYEEFSSGMSKKETQEALLPNWNANQLMEYFEVYDLKGQLIGRFHNQNVLEALASKGAGLYLIKSIAGNEKLSYKYFKR